MPRIRMTLAPVTSWRIHIGAHKTATTHLQETLSAIRPVLVERGVDYIPNPELRQDRLRQGARAQAALEPGAAPARPDGAAGGGAELDPLRAGPATLVLSEEKLLGGSQEIFAEPIYPGLQRIMRCSRPSADAPS